MEKSLAEEFLDMGEEWQGAIEALLASNTPNPKPLAALIRGSASIPSGVREMLAELLDPQEPEYLYFRLVLKSTRTPAQRAHLVKITNDGRPAVLKKFLSAKVNLRTRQFEAVNKKGWAG